jgi:adenylate cyclase
MGWTLLTTVLVMTLVAVLFTRLNVILATLAVVPLLLLVIGSHFAALVWNGWVTEPVLPLAGVLACFVSITTRRWWQDNRQRRRVRRAFEFYLHPTVVQKVSEQPDALQLGGAATELSILFSDIRSFTSIAEQLRDDELTKLLNEYLTAMTNVVFDNSGTVDKYIGDAIMAFYGAPVTSTIHAEQSCRTALQMSQQLSQMRQEWQQQGLPPIRIGVGINTDTVRVGNFGSTVRFDYTVIGDGVNLASRLEGANKQYGTEILISESTWEQVHSNFATRELDLIQVKGRQRPTRIFELLGERPLEASLASWTEEFESALASYRAQDFAKARAAFEVLNANHPDDLPVELYIRRCTQFLEQPPGDGWDGVFVMTTK